jgi:hypothetical protein
MNTNKTNIPGNESVLMIEHDFARRDENYRDIFKKLLSFFSSNLFLFSFKIENQATKCYLYIEDTARHNRQSSLNGRLHRADANPFHTAALDVVTRKLLAVSQSKTVPFLHFDFFERFRRALSVHNQFRLCLVCMKLMKRKCRF